MTKNEKSANTQANINEDFGNHILPTVVQRKRRTECDLDELEDFYE